MKWTNYGNREDIKCPNMSHDMKLTKATNNALHTMLLLAVDSPDKHIGVAKLAERQEVSMTYLSKNDCLLSI